MTTNHFSTMVLHPSQMAFSSSLGVCRWLAKNYFRPVLLSSNWNCSTIVIVLQRRRHAHALIPRWRHAWAQSHPQGLGSTGSCWACPSSAWLPPSSSTSSSTPPCSRYHLLNYRPTKYAPSSPSTTRSWSTLPSPSSLASSLLSSSRQE